MRNLLLVAACVLTAAPSAGAVLFQNLVSPVGGVATFDAPPPPAIEAYHRFWIGVDTGTITGGQWEVEGSVTILAWDPVGGGYDDDDNPIPAIVGTDHLYFPSCYSTLAAPVCTGPVSTTLTANVFGVSFNPPADRDDCTPSFTGDTSDCFFQYNFGGSNYAVYANSARDVTFTLYDADPTLAAVPEPAAWALLTAGFATIGAAMRRRRVHAAA